MCTQDVCSDGKGRRPIGDDCCACPEKSYNCHTKHYTRELWSKEKTIWCCKNHNLGCLSPSQ